LSPDSSEELPMLYLAACGVESYHGYYINDQIKYVLRVLDMSIF